MEGREGGIGGRGMEERGGGGKGDGMGQNRGEMDRGNV